MGLIHKDAVEAHQAATVWRVHRIFDSPADLAQDRHVASTRAYAVAHGGPVPDAITNHRLAEADKASSQHFTLLTHRHRLKMLIDKFDDPSIRADMLGAAFTLAHVKQVFNGTVFFVNLRRKDLFDDLAHFRR